MDVTDPRDYDKHRRRGISPRSGWYNHIRMFRHDNMEGYDSAALEAMNGAFELLEIELFLEDVFDAEDFLHDDLPQLYQRGMSAEQLADVWRRRRAGEIHDSNAAGRAAAIAAADRAFGSLTDDMTILNERLDRWLAYICNPDGWAGEPHEVLAAQTMVEEYRTEIVTRCQASNDPDSFKFYASKEALRRYPDIPGDRERNFIPRMQLEWLLQWAGSYVAVGTSPTIGDGQP